MSNANLGWPSRLNTTYPKRYFLLICDLYEYALAITIRTTFFLSRISLRNPVKPA